MQYIKFNEIVFRGQRQRKTNWAISLILDLFVISMFKYIIKKSMLNSFCHLKIKNTVLRQH